MDKLQFSSHCDIIIELNDISAESALNSILEVFRHKYPFTEVISSYNYIKKIVKPCSLASFNSMEEILSDFEKKYPLTKIYQNG